jgi:hypothetical protein
VEHSKKATQEKEMNYDQTREAVESDNIALNLGIVAGWASLIKTCPNQVSQQDRDMEQYIRRLYAVVRDIVFGTPNANTSIYTCDIPDTQLADKITPYIVSTMRSQAAMERAVPNALTKVVARLKTELVV